MSTTTKLFHTTCLGQVCLVEAESAERAKALAKKRAIERLAARVANAPAEKAAECAAQLASATRTADIVCDEVKLEGRERYVAAFTPREMG